jgi:hypothetical protein
MRNAWLLIAAIAARLGLLGADAGASGFTRLMPLPKPEILTNSPAYPGGAHEAVHLLDGDPRTEYSSSSRGTNTVVEFNFSGPVLLGGFRHVDRADPATVASSELSFFDMAGKQVGSLPVTHANQRSGVTFVALPSPVTAQRVRWRVTGLGPERYTTVGGAELAFFTVGKPEPAPVGLTLQATAFPVLRRSEAGLATPVQVRVDYPYVEPVEARVSVEGAAPTPLTLSLGTHVVETTVAAVRAEKTITLSLEWADRTLAKSGLRLTPAPELTVYVLPHSHVDVGYTELQPDVEQKQMRNIARGLELVRSTLSYPEGARFKWNVEVLWAVESYLRRASAQQRTEFFEAVRKGWLGLDAMYGNELTGLCRPEELLRLFRYATELSRQTGVPVESAMISDVPGYTWGTVQAMAQAGVKYFSIAPNYFDRIGTILEVWENRPFYWVSASGREKVLCWAPYYGYALSHVIRELRETFLLDLAAKLRNQGYPYSIAYLRWSGHGDNAPPDERLSESIRQWNSKYAWPKLIIATTAEAFCAFEERHGAQLPKVSGDWTPYWEDGAGSSARETALNRATAERLVQAETLWALLNPQGFPSAAFHEAWRNLLLYSEHTWGAHNSISQPDLPFVKEQWRIKQAFALDADVLSHRLLANALVRVQDASRPTNAFDVWNTCPWPRTDLVTVPTSVADLGSALRDERGRLLPTQRLASGHLVFVARDVPSLASRRYYIHPGWPVEEGQARVKPGTLENTLLKVRVDERTGNITELRARGLSGNLVDAQSAGLNEFLYVKGAESGLPFRAGPVSIGIKEPGPLVVALLIEGEAPGCRTVTREVRVIDGLDRVEVINTVDKLPVRDKEGVHFAFAFSLERPVLRLEAPWAVVRPETDQIPSACKNWFTVQRWVDVAEPGRGVTVALLDAPLVEVGSLTANLIGSQHNPRVWLARVEPSARWYSWVMNNHWHTNYRAEQEGPTVFRYALRPHRGFEPLQAYRFGVEQSQPLIATPAVSNPPRRPRLQVTPDSVVITAFKPSDDQRAWIVRLFGAGGKDARARLRWSAPVPRSVHFSDLSERPLQPARQPIEVPAWGIVTLRAELAE